MALDEDLRTEILAASTTLGQRCHQNVVPEHQGNVFPRCYYRRAATEPLLAVDASALGLVWNEYDVEMISTTLTEAVAAADAVRSAFNGKRGTFGSGTIQGCFVEDQSDDYEPRGIGADEGAHVSALRLRIATDS